MTDNDFEPTHDADSESVVPGSPARLRLDARLRAARSLRASLRHRPSSSLSYESATAGLGLRSDSSASHPSNK